MKKSKAKKKKVTKKSKVLTVSKPKTLVVDNSPASMISKALSSGASIEQLDKYLSLQERYEANEAKKAYSNSMVSVHSRIPLVKKTLVNKQTNSTYASLTHIVCETKKIYTDEGFSICFYEGETQKPEHIRICADVTHRLGHKETFYLDMPLEAI